MTGPILTRRRLLTGAAALAAPALVGLPGRAAPGLALRVGAVLPLGGAAMPEGPANLGIAAEAACKGAVLAEEDLTQNAGLFGGSVELFAANAPGAAAAERAARRMVAQDGVSVLVGGFDDGEALALSRVAQETGTVFLNIGASGDALRAGACGGQTFHVAASAAMYLDALAGWFVRAGARRWHIVTAPGHEARVARLRAALDDRHWGARIVGQSDVDPLNGLYDTAVAEIAESAPDLVICLTDWYGQVGFLARYEAAGAQVPVTGFPDVMAQTRHFYALARQAAPRAGTGHRAAQWEATLDAYGARELNARFGARWGQPMEPVAWAAYQALRIAWEGAQRAGTPEGRAIAAAVADPAAVYDVHKGIGVSFRPWDRQLRQSLFLVRINPPGAPAQGLAPLEERADLVGELPAIYMPGTDPVERLDQLGDLKGRESC